MIEIMGSAGDRASALELLCRHFNSKKTVRCTSCRSDRYYVVARGVLRCARCRTDYRPFGSRAAINRIL